MINKDVRKHFPVLTRCRIDDCNGRGAGTFQWEIRKVICPIQENKAMASFLAVIRLDVL